MTAVESLRGETHFCGTLIAVQADKLDVAIAARAVGTLPIVSLAHVIHELFPVTEDRTCSTANQAQLVRMLVDDVEANGGDGADEATLLAVVVVVRGHEMALVVERLVEHDRRGGVAVLAEVLLQRPLRRRRPVLARPLAVGLPLLAECEAPLPLLDDLSLLLLDYPVVKVSEEKFIFRALWLSVS